MDIRKLIQIVKRSFTLTSQGSDTVLTVDISSFGNQTKSEVIYPYGYFAQGHSRASTLVIVPVDHADRPLHDFRYLAGNLEPLFASLQSG